MTNTAFLEKLSVPTFKISSTGFPILKDVAGYLDCKVVRSCIAGDHTIFIGEVIAGGTTPDSNPMLYKHEDFFGKK